MGIKRIVDTSFWTDGKVDEFSPEDKYFMLYLLTNPFSTQLGIYEISVKQVAFQMGYSMDSVRVLIDRFENKYGMIFFSPATNEIAIKNFLRHSIMKGGAPVRDCLIKEMKAVKDKALIARVFAHIKGHERLNETVKNIIAEYEEKNGTLHYSNEKQNDNENDNDNEVSCHDTGNESFNDSSDVPPPEKSKVDCQAIVDLYHSICKSFPSVRSLSDARKKVIKARLKTYTLDDFRKVFEGAEASSFLKGVDGGWKASFDWLIKEANMLKVLEGNYVDKPRRFGRKEPVPGWCERRELSPDELDAIRQMMEEDEPNTIGNDPQLAERAERLRNQLQGA